MKDMSDTNDKTWIQQEDEKFIEGLKKYPDAIFRSAYTPPTEEDLKRILDEMKSAPIYLQDSDTSYSDLQNAPAEELLEAAVLHYSKIDPSAEKRLRLGFMLASTGGWANVSCSWLKAHREAKAVEFKGHPYIQHK